MSNLTHSNEQTDNISDKIIPQELCNILEQVVTLEAGQKCEMVDISSVIDEFIKLSEILKRTTDVRMNVKSFTFQLANNLMAQMKIKVKIVIELVLFHRTFSHTITNLIIAPL